MKKTIILPIISIIFMAITAITGHQFDEATIESVATAVAVLITTGLSIYGVLKDHKKKEDEK